MFQKVKYEVKNGEGSLFKNDRKAKETDPDYNGSVRIADVDYSINGWKKQAKSGVQYVKLSARVKGEKSTDKSAPDFDDSPDF